MTLSELLGRKISITTFNDEEYADVTLLNINHPLFATVKNRAGSILFVAWNGIAEIRFVSQENRRRPKSPKAAAGEGAPGEGSDPKPQIH